MSKHSFSLPPSWLLQPSGIANVISNHFASLKDVSSLVKVPNFSTFSSGLRQALFWRRRLAPSASSHTLIFSLLGIQGLNLPNVLEVCQALRDICNMHNLVETYKASNSSFIGLSFNNSHDVSLIRTHFSYFQDSVVIHVTPASSLFHHFKLSWLPPLFPDARVHHFLSKHSVKHQFIRDLVPTDIDQFTPANSVTGTLELSPSYDFSALPHLIPLPAPHLGHALLTISGHPSPCLKCGQIGHIRRSCTAGRCASCHHFHFSTTSCSITPEASHAISSNFWPDVELESSPSAIPPFADFASSSVLSTVDPATPIKDRSTSTSLTGNITMPSYLSDVTANNHTPIISKCVSSSFLKSNQFDVLTNDLSSHSDTFMFSPPKEHSALSKLPLLSTSSHSSSLHNAITTLPLSKHQEAFLAAKRAKKSSLASKRNCSSSSSSSHNLSSNNIYSVLEDESISMSVDNINSEVSSIPLNNLVYSSSVTLDTTDPVIIASPQIASDTMITSSHKKPKKFKKSSSVKSPVVLPLLSRSSVNKDVGSSWGERMEDMTEFSLVSVPDLSPSDTSIAAAKDLLPTPSTIISEMPIIATSTNHIVSDSPSDHPILATSIVTADTVATVYDSKELEDDITISLKGFPYEALKDELHAFAGHPSPYAIYTIHNSEDIFEAHHLMYRKHDDIHPILHKDGQWVGSSIISVSLLPDSSDSD